MTDVGLLNDLTGKVALVTGGGGLLGGAFVEGLAAAGAQVFSIDISEAALKRRIDAYPDAIRDRVEPVAVDITDEQAIEAAVSAIKDRFGAPKILINSAAVDPKFEGQASVEAPSGAFTSYPVELWKRSLDVNLTGAFLTTRAVCRHMEQADGGVIVNIASTYGIVGPDQRLYAQDEEPGSPQKFFKPVDYSTTKAGILGFTRALAAYYAGTKIRVNALTPGGTYNGNPDDFVLRYSSRTISRRMAAPSDYIGAIVFLCSDASSYMTGGNLVVDGGWTAL